MRRYRGFHALETRLCPRCHTPREFNKRVANHRLHLVATVLTAGLWGFGWLAVSIAQARRPWRCSICRTRAAGSETGEFHPVKMAIVAPRD